MRFLSIILWMVALQFSLSLLFAVILKVIFYGGGGKDDRPELCFMIILPIFSSLKSELFILSILFIYIGNNIRQ